MIVVHYLPGLNKLDNNIVTPEEKAQSKLVKPLNEAPEVAAGSSQNSIQQGSDPSNAGVLSAVLTLVKELGKSSLQGVHEHISTLISSKR